MMNILTRTPSLRGRPVSAVILLISVFALIGAPYLFDAYGVGLLTEALILGLWAMSLNVLAGQTGLISLGHAGTLGVSAYTSAWLQSNQGWSFVPASLAAIAAACVISVLFALTASRSSGVYFILVTLAQGMLVWGIVQRWSSVTGGDNGLRGGGVPDGLSKYWAFYWFTLVVVLLSLIILRLLDRGSVGLRLRGTRESALRMSALGYSVDGERFKAFVLSGLFAGVAGVLYVGHFQFISPSTVYVSSSVEVLLMVIIGGMGSFLGPMVGAVVLVMGRAFITSYTERWHLVMGAILVLMVLFAPDGLVGRMSAFGKRRPAPSVSR